jgi:hypothetical protein
MIWSGSQWRGEARQARYGREWFGFVRFGEVRQAEFGHGQVWQGK